MRILLAIDDSIYSRAATDKLIAQAKAEGVEVRLLHVLDPFPKRLAETLSSEEHPDFVAARLKQRERANKFLDEASRKLESYGFKVSSSIAEGDATSIILCEAETWNADLIVLGSHSRVGLDRLLMGSVAEAVAKHARCSVEIVRPRSAS